MGHKKQSEEIRCTGPSHPEWDKRRCGYAVRGGGFCSRFRSKRADGTSATYCNHHNKHLLNTVAGKVKSGYHSYILREEVSAKFNYIRDNTNVLDLEKDIALFRAIFQRGIEYWQDNEKTFTLDEAGWIFNKLERISALVDTLTRIKMNAALTVAEIHFLQLGMATILKKYVPPERLREAVEEIFRLTATDAPTVVQQGEVMVDGRILSAK